MSTQTKTEFKLQAVPKEILERGRQMAGLSHDVWLAGLGAVAAVEQEGADLYNTLVKRGRKVENAGRKMVGELRDDVVERQKKVTERVEENVYQPMITALKRFGVPTRTEIRELSAKVDMLTRRVDLLVSRMPRGGEPSVRVEYAVYHVTAEEGNGWAVGKEGVAEPISILPNKESAIEEARTLARKDMPSRLHVYKRDGSIQDSFTYDE